MVLEEFLSEWSNDSDRVLVHTSGSTGKPKPMWVEKRKMLNSARITCDFLGLKPGDTALLCMNLKYIGAKMVVVRALERHMRLVSVPADGHPMAHLAASGRPAPTFAAMVPLQVYNTLQVPAEAALLRQTRHLIIGGGAIDESLEAALRGFPHAVWSTYGMTETLSHIALRRLNGPEADPWYRPLPSVSVTLNAEGCLVVYAPLVHDGPLVTNDRAEIVQGKGFRILGRKDNVIVSGGIKIQIEEVERALKPYVQDPFVVAKRNDAKFGEAMVLLTEAADIQTVMAVCRRMLPKYWVPREVRHVDAVPMTETGKPKRNVLL